jgi:transposase-like protein
LEAKSQHFLLSKAARTLSIRRVSRMSKGEARAAFIAIRFSENEERPFCPRCGCTDVYALATRDKFKCKEPACHHQFSPTSGTIFASRKLAYEDLLLAIALFANSAKGISAIRLGAELDVQYKTAFVLMHKLREALVAQQAAYEPTGEVEIDGAYYGGYVRPKNHEARRVDRRRLPHKSGKRLCVTVVRERRGRTRTFVHSEAETAAIVPSIVKPGTIIYTDENKVYDDLHARFDVRRVNHSKQYADGSASTNWAESFHSRMRRAEIGTHHQIATRREYLAAYAGESVWREDNRRISNGEQFFAILTAGLHHPVSRMWKGYWQRRKVAA